MRVAVGSDHAGYELKKRALEWLTIRGVEVLDLGPVEYDAKDDYPDFARAVAESVGSGGADLGLLVCSTGVGSCIAANKVPQVRAALCHDSFSARMSREHNDANVLCLGANIVGPSLAREIVEAWLSGDFSGEKRHRRRVAKIAEMEMLLRPKQ